MSLGFAERAEVVIRALRPGEVVTYGEVAADAGRPGAARAVGHLLATRPAEEIRMVAEFLGPYAARIGGRCAVIAPASVQFGLTQMGAVHAERVGDEVFRLLNLVVLGFLELSVGDAAAADRILRPLAARLTASGWRARSAQAATFRAVSSACTDATPRSDCVRAASS